MVARGMSNHQIAVSLHLSEATIKRHLANIYPRIGVSSRGEAVRKALSNRWITARDITGGEVQACLAEDLGFPLAGYQATAYRSLRAGSTEQRTPPRWGGGDLFQVLRPEQPPVSARKAHIYGYVSVSPVMVRDPTHHAASLGDPMALAHPYRRTDMHSFRLHDAPSAVRRPNPLFLSRVFTHPPTGRRSPNVPRSSPITVEMSVSSDTMGVCREAM